MIKKILSSVMLLPLLMLLASCSSVKLQPTLNVSEHVPSSLTTHQVKECIHRAGTQKKWLMEDIKPGLIRGTIYVRNHEAKIDIAYSKENYSINYHSSEHLMHKNNMIHRNYNKWIILLNEAILKQMNSKSAN